MDVEELFCDSGMYGNRNVDEMFHDTNFENNNDT